MLNFQEVINESTVSFAEESNKRYPMTIIQNPDGSNEQNGGGGTRYSHKRHSSNASMQSNKLIKNNHSNKNQ